MYKKLKSFLSKHCYISEWVDYNDTKYNVYLSKFDNSYIGMVGLERNLKFLVKFGIDTELSTYIGYSSKRKKWYGWSHRCIKGFKIGSKIRKGYPGFFPSNKEEYIQDYLDFWTDEDRIAELGEITDEYFMINFKYIKESDISRIDNVQIPFPEEWGKGEWVATSMEDAKQMALDFSNDVS